MGDWIVLDPGHGGGVEPHGHSTPRGVAGPRGTLEKDLTLAIARLLQQLLEARGFEARLTRDSDDNPSLRERVAQAAGAAAFVSLHFNASNDPTRHGSEIFVHDQQRPRSRSLALLLRSALGGTLRLGPLSVLEPSWHEPQTAACLIEIDYLTNPDVERRFALSETRREVAEAIAQGIASFFASSDANLARPALRVVEQTRESFDIWHEVPLVPQLTGMSCWAAAAAMIVGWRDCIDVRPDEVAHGAGAWEEYRDGLEPKSVDALANTFGLVVETPRSYAVDAVRRLLERHGPLWVGAGPTGLHVVVVSGMVGDGSPDGTFVRVLDPWPIGRGERYTISFRELAKHLQEASDVAGVRASILHCGTLARGNRGRSLQLRRSYEATESLGRRAAEPPSSARYGTPLALFRIYQDAPPGRDLPGQRAPGVFTLTGAHLSHLVAARNAIMLGAGAPGVVVFGLRGCRQVSPGSDGVWSSTTQLDEDVPSQPGFGCVLGLFRPADAQFALFAGSTRQNGRSLDPGCYGLRLGDPRSAPELFSVRDWSRFHAMARGAAGPASTLRYLLLTAREARLASTPAE